MRRQDGGAGRGARGFRDTHSKLPGGAGLRPGTQGYPARSSLTAWTRKEVLAESADRTPSNAAMERREAPHTLLVCALDTRTRRLALHPLDSEGGENSLGNGAGKAACPGPFKNTGDFTRSDEI
jgi:hypothetical protein